MHASDGMIFSRHGRSGGGGACPQAPSWDGRALEPRAAGDSRPHRGRGGFGDSRGFTLIEILLVLALLALFGTIFVSGVTPMLRAMDSRGPEQLLNEAILGAREQALSSGREIELRYDAEKRHLVWHGAGGVQVEELPLGTSVELLPMEKGGSILLGGVLTEAQEPLRRVRFFPDGTCDPFRIRVREPERAPRLLVVDPWTCAASRIEMKGGA